MFSMPHQGQVTSDKCVLTGGPRGAGHLNSNDYSSPANQLAKSWAIEAHASLSSAIVLQTPPPCSAMNLRKGSSHFIHRRVDGLISLLPPISMAAAFQTESRQKVTRQSHVEADLLAACPAQNHFLSACVCTQSQTPAADARSWDVCVALCSQGSHSSPTALETPHILLSILFCIERIFLSSSARGVHA